MSYEFPKDCDVEEEEGLAEFNSHQDGWHSNRKSLVQGASTTPRARWRSSRSSCSVIILPRWRRRSRRRGKSFRIRRTWTLRTSRRMSPTYNSLHWSCSRSLQEDGCGQWRTWGQGEGGGNHPAEIMCEDVTAIKGGGYWWYGGWHGRGQPGCWEILLARSSADILNEILDSDWLLHFPHLWTSIILSPHKNTNTV